jgi:dehydro coenzyme F420 reductase / coenzyme F420-0:L-glutamate ligase / coenzyme F420-1:gamma-L-glutamate ligase
MTLEVNPVRGVPEIREGDDLAEALVRALGADALRDGDVVAVTQKVVSKAEGRLVAAADGKRGWVERESRRVVARRDDLVIAETRHGFVCASAGVDESNVPAGMVTLLPEDPDRSAADLRERIRSRAGAEVGVIITDTFGRPWRRGLVDVAIGCAGVPGLADLRGTPDAVGRPLEVTVVAVADQLAAAAGAVMDKAGAIPAAVIRGLTSAGPPGRGRDLVRPPDEDLFRFGPLEVLSARRTVREFGPGGVPREVLVRAVAAALTAPVPHGSRHPSRPWAWVLLESEAARRRYLAAMAEAWVRDLRGDGTPDEVIEHRLARSDSVLGRAPVLAVPHLSLERADRYLDERRATAERDMFLLATGAGVQNFMVALTAQGFGSAWVSSSLFCKDEAREAVDLDPGWIPMGTVAVGPFPGEPPPRPPVDPAPNLHVR